jgi:hypothetical protein
MSDVAARLANRVQLTTDGHKPYLGAVEDAFGGDVDYVGTGRLQSAYIRQYAAVTTVTKGWVSPFSRRFWWLLEGVGISGAGDLSQGLMGGAAWSPSTGRSILSALRSPSWHASSQYSWPSFRPRRLKREAIVQGLVYTLKSSIVAS